MLGQHLARFPFFPLFSVSVYTQHFDFLCTAFHHVTRWKLLVFSIKEQDGVGKYDLVIPKYIPYDEESGVVTETITIDDEVEDDKYPGKHRDNFMHRFPLSLYQQALRATMKVKGTC